MSNLSKILSSTPLVSVSIITYNHKEFIRNTLDGVLAQQVNFEYEIIIGDDFSSDGTQEILKEYQQKYPDRIHLILHPRNYDCIPGRINNITNLYACRGKYIAMLDGDDYWRSTDKLQKQIDFLEANEEFTLVFNETMFRYPDGREAAFSLEPNKEWLLKQTIFTHDDLLQSWFVQTSAMVFRNANMGVFPEWFWKIYSADYAIQLIVTQAGGLIKYFPDIYSVRNFHPKSFTATQQKKFATEKLLIDQIYYIGEDFPKFKKLRYPILGRTYWQWARRFFSKDKKASFIYFLKGSKYLFLSYLNPDISVKRKLSGPIKAIRNRWAKSLNT